MVVVREMTRADAAAVVAPIRESGWGDRQALFDLFLRVDRCRPFVAVDDAPSGDEVVATSCAIANGPVGWIGMVWVRPDRRRQGLGRLVTERACADLEARGCTSLVLIASADGQPVYDGMGFRVVAEYAIYDAPRLATPPAPPTGIVIRPMGQGDLEGVAALDRRATGEDRRPVLEYLSVSGWVAVDASTDPMPSSGRSALRGFLLPTDEATGAVVADAPDAALALLDVRRHLSPTVARAAVLAEAKANRAALDAAGWRFLFTTPRMVRGPELPWEPELIWGVTGFSMG